MLERSRVPLRGLLALAGGPVKRFLADESDSLRLGILREASAFGDRLEALRGRTVLLAVKTQMACAVGLIELDGVARRILLCPPDVPPRFLPSVLESGGVDVIVGERDLPEYDDRPVVHLDWPPVAQRRADHTERQPTEWVLLTSGTTGQPKMVVHNLVSLSGHLPFGPQPGSPPVWCTFYDIRRYGGLQMLLRALLGGGSMVLSGAAESPEAFLIRAAALGVTHVVGTPSHWRRALMSGQASRINPTYVRLSGEIADQAILDRLKATYPEAVVAHAFASTEAGVGFEVTDGLAGFPETLIGQAGAAVALQVIDGSLRIRSARTAAGYLHGDIRGVTDDAGFVDTGDMVERHDGRYYFVGRKEGIVNIGGQKVPPEEVEAVINRHPGVEMSLVKGRPSPITGAILVAEVIAKRPEPAAADTAPAASEAVLIAEILDLCRTELPPHKVPATIRIVPSLDVSPSGKLVRPHA